MCTPLSHAVFASQHTWHPMYTTQQCICHLVILTGLHKCLYLACTPRRNCNVTNEVGGALLPWLPEAIPGHPRPPITPITEYTSRQKVQHNKIQPHFNKERSVPNSSEVESEKAKQCNKSRNGHSNREWHLFKEQQLPTSLKVAAIVFIAVCSSPF